MKTIQINAGLKKMIITLFTPCKVIQILEYNKFLLVESRVMGFGIHDPALGVQKPDPESKFHRQGIQNPVVGIQNPWPGIQNSRLSWIT